MRVVGDGPDLVLLHGWGLNAGIWQTIEPSLQSHFRLWMPDLPGHGQAPFSADSRDLSAWVSYLLESLPERFFCLGWSLGGLLALDMALRQPTRVERLALVASNAQFACTDSWPHAMQPDVLNDFAEQLTTGFEKTLHRFLMLQAQGGEQTKDTIRHLKRHLAEQGTPQLVALQAGLEILKRASLVDRLPAVKQPTALIYGQADRLVPAEAASMMAQLLPHAQLSIIKNAGHAPFISHSEQFVALVTLFFQNKSIMLYAKPKKDDV